MAVVGGRDGDDIVRKQMDDGWRGRAEIQSMDSIDDDER